jgi:hypothetical protein
MGMRSGRGSDKAAGWRSAKKGALVQPKQLGVSSPRSKPSNDFERDAITRALRSATAAEGAFGQSEDDGGGGGGSGNEGLSDFNLSTGSGSPIWGRSSSKNGQARVTSYDSSVDVYSFSHLMWAVWEGTSVDPGLTGKTTAHALQMICHEQYRPQIRAECPDEIANLIRRGWAAVPSERPTFAQICVTLRGLLEDAGASPLAKEDQASRHREQTVDNVDGDQSAVV